jgi:type VI secretion system secreted protein VgrG
MPTKTFTTSVTTPLGADELLFNRLTGHDEMGRLFEFELELLRPEALGSVDSSVLVGDDMTVKIAPSEGATRYINGAVVQFKHTGMINRFYCYRATLRPWLWFLTLNANCRIFQDKTVTDIIKAVFADYSFADVEYHLEGSYETLTYCVQYRESDFNFVSRLMEHEGIFYYFKHQQDKHTLVIADSGSNYQQITDYSTIPYFPVGNTASRERDHIDEWLSGHQVCTGKYELNDFDFESPSADLTAKSQQLGEFLHNNMEVYDYPGKYSKANVGTQFTDKRIEELHSPSSLVHGHGNALGLQSGLEFTLSGFYFTEENVKHIIVSADYEIGGVGGYASGNGGDGEIFNCRFVAIKAEQQFRSARITPKPIISGTQTAIVVGKSGEEIWTDKYGRVKVKFHWDRDPETNEKSSCWIRVSFPTAGKKWGWVSLPRIGQEVIVSFLEGDPDQPLITGRVYNSEQMPPYDLPANQTQSGIKTRSSKEGVADNFNEIRFEDKKDSEEVYVHAEKDFNCVIENNETRKIGLDKKDAGDQTIEIHNNRTITLNEGNDTLTVKKGNRLTDINTGNETLNVKQGNRITSVDTGDNTLTVKTGNRVANIDTGNDTLTVKTGNRVTNVNTGNDTKTVKLGNHVINVNAGKSTIEAMTSIELKVGANSIKIEQSGITINGVKIDIKATTTLDAKGLTTTVNADAILTLKGSMTMIN